VAAARAKFTTSGAFEAPVDLVRPAEELELVLELLPHAATTSETAIAPRSRASRVHARGALLRVMSPPLVVHIGRMADMSNICVAVAGVKRRVSQSAGRALGHLSKRIGQASLDNVETGD